MRHHRVTPSLLLVSTAAVAMACGDGTAPKPKTLNVSALVQESSLGTVGSAATSMAAGFSLPSLVPDTRNCTLDATERSYRCHPSSIGGISVSLTYTLLDASGQPQTDADPAVIDAIHTVLDMSGTLTVPSTQAAQSITLERHDDKVLSGLLASAHELNGTATSTTGLTLSSGTWNMSTNERTTGVRFGAVGHYSAMPIAGTVVTDVTSQSAGTASVTSHITMSFASTGDVTLVMNAGTITTTCVFNLAQTTVGFGSSCH